MEYRMKTGETLIEYRKIGLLATCIGNERIRIDTNGGLYYSRNSQECEFGELWSDGWKLLGRMDSLAVIKLVRAIRESGLLALSPTMVDEECEGGRREELLLVIDTVDHRYLVQNVDDPSFKKAVRLLWGVLAEHGAAN
jgi:hypothetical protein